ncbi:YeiH family protein [Bacillus sp. FJAT-45066]|uniref:YeiH family protein n=1 Tax=Bacillus sp. FJAT-45066 TaxID=2011010 RepID=UPI000BB70F54|nr:putative sulfate exporter family transporter [Bacillus sp. FJAT-45066]
MNFINRFYQVNPAIPGIGLSFLIAIVAYFIGIALPAVGGVIIALLIGIIVRNTVRLPSSFETGILFVVKILLKVAIILLGATLSISSMIQAGTQSIIPILLVVVGGTVIAILIGKIFRINNTLSLLIGVGTSICGATAISVVKSVVQAKEAIIAYAITTIFLFNIIATITYPLIGQWLQLSAVEFGIWIGTSIHDTSSVVAVGYLIGDEVGEVATTVKLVRTLFILPLVLILSIIFTRKTTAQKFSFKQAFPIFIVGFLVMSFLYSFEIIPEHVSITLGMIAKFIIVMVMAAVGLQVNWSKFKSLGVKPILVGLIASVFVASVSLWYVLVFI